MFQARQALTGYKLKLDESRIGLNIRTVKMAYDPAGREGHGADEINFADLDYIAVNDNGRPSRRSAAHFAVTFFALAFSGFYWLLS
ncbi:hypothetical protein [Rhizobium sp. EC-SD404]|uniref:hypothetical protein n=1 Tax=Rhizobium sp. EC-SD404 TaxID=2038389 RepID=UPI0012574534|nr:hypothetical protein [Rhizobium sp. EC-SD404]VVT31879.1 hypothetical protein RHIZ404_230419 [Rhizobium sp. EC-SD404]